jgi:hypothetical protein
MPTPVEAFLDAWRAAADRHDVTLVEPWLAEDVQLCSPAFFRPKQGRAEVAALLADVIASLSTYRITKTWIDGNELLLEFDGSVGKMLLRGIDRISLDAAGHLARLEVWVRPYRGLRALMSAVGERQLGRMSLPTRVLARTRAALSRGT